MITFADVVALLPGVIAVNGEVSETPLNRSGRASGTLVWRVFLRDGVPYHVSGDAILSDQIHNNAPIPDHWAPTKWLESPVEIKTTDTKDDLAMKIGESKRSLANAFIRIAVRADALALHIDPTCAARTYEREAYL